MINKSTHIHIKVSEEEKSAIEKRSSSIGLNISAYLRMLAAKDIKGDK